MKRMQKSLWPILAVPEIAEAVAAKPVVIEPFLAAAFPIIKDLMVDRTAFDRIIAADIDSYFLMETRVEDIVRDEAILPKYRRAGIVHVYVGLEATDQHTLDLFPRAVAAVSLRRQGDV